MEKRQNIPEPVIMKFNAGVVILICL